VCGGSSTPSIDCANGIIQVSSASFGRSSTLICSTGYTSAQLSNTACFSDQTTFMKNLCDGTNTCSTNPIPFTFGIGDPCLGTYKYLTVAYKCIIPSNYWPMSDLKDVVGGANLYGGSSYSFTYDRICSPNSAIYFNNGYLQVPPGVYFSGNFTFIAWIYLKSYQAYSRVFDFGAVNGVGGNNILLMMSDTSSNLIGMVYATPAAASSVGPATIQLNQWYQVAYVVRSNTGYIYLNGILIATSTSGSPNNVQRIYNYIGKPS